MLLGGGYSNTGSDLLYVKKMLKVRDITGMKISYNFHNISSSLDRNLRS